MLLRFDDVRNDREAVPGYADSCPKVQLPVRAAGTALVVVAARPAATDSGWMALARDEGSAPRVKRQPARPRRPPVPPLLALQTTAGNTAVAGLVAQRAAATATAQAPAQDPKFQSLKHDIAAKSRTAKAHPPASAEVKKAQDAAVAPPDDKEAQAKAAQADKMAGAKPGGFDKPAFVAAVNAAIAKQAPKNLDEADKFATSGKADQLKSDVMGQVTTGKEQSAKDVTDRTKEAPDTSKAVEKPVTPLADTPPPPAIAPPDARKAVPDKAPAEQTDLSADKHETNDRMATAGVTEEQLAQSNEPEFTDALAAKKQGERHSDTAPAAVRASEAQTLAAATGAAQATGKAGVAALTGAKGSQAQKGNAAKNATKSKDQQDRIAITAEIKAIFDETKTKVEGVLNGLDDEVAKRFESGEARAKAAFTADHQARMRKYKDERYSGVSGAAAWTYDLFAGLPAEANDLFVQAKKVYESQMQVVIGEVADHIGTRLAEAKRLITEGRDRVKAKVESKSPALRKLAAEAAKEFEGQFDDLEKSVDEKQQSLVDDLAQKYVEARDAVDEEIKKLQEENKGWWDKAKEAVGGAIETIGKLKDMLLGVLARAAGAVELIIKDPIGFLGNLVNAVKTGVVNFGSRIADHLKQGLKAWLLGNLASAGVEIPETFDVKGILRMVMSILGLTWASVRARIVRVVPEPVMVRLEQTLDVVKIMVAEGLPGLWKWVVEKLGDLKELVMGQIKEFVVEKIVKAGITWIISMLNPAAAFIKACKAIYDVVMFFVDKAAQIKEFVDSVLDSIESIARGGVGAVAGLIENTLAKALPMVLGFLASLLGLGGISEKIKSILEKVQAPVGRVVDSVVGTVVKAGRKLLGKLKGGKGRKGGEAEGGRPQQGTSPAGTGVIDEAKKRTQSSLGDGTPMNTGMAAMRDLRTDLASSGLKGLKLVLNPGTRKFEVWATASPWQKIDEFAPKTTFSAYDLKLIPEKKGGDDYAAHSSVIASVSVDGSMVREIGRFDSVRAHAEMNFARKLTTSWPDHVGSYYKQERGAAAKANGAGTGGATGSGAEPATPEPNHSFRFLAKVTRGPCGPCTTELVGLKEHLRTAVPRRYPHATADLAVEATGVYAKHGYAYRDQEHGLAVNRPGDPQAGQLQIWRMLKAGIDVGVLTLDDVTSKAVADQLSGRQRWYLGKVNDELRQLLAAIKAGTKTF